MRIKEKLSKLYQHIMEPQHDLQYEILCCVVFISLLILSVFLKPVALLCFAVSAGMMLLLKNDALFRFLLFAFPFAVAFKMDPDSSSFFTYMEFLALFLMIIRLRRISLVVVVPMGILLVTVILGMQSFGAIVDVVKLVAGLLILYYFTEEYQKVDMIKYFSFFIAGMVSSSFLGAFKLHIPRLLDMYYGEIDYVNVGSKTVMRFEGIFNDPNYFSVAAMFCVVVCLLTLLSRTYKGNKNNKYIWIGSAVGFVLFSILGLATISKSFFLLYIVSCALIIWSAYKDSPLMKQLNPKTMMMVGAIIIITVVVIDPFGLISSIISRLTSSNLLTGRGVIWADYWKAITQSAGSVFFGNGIDAALVNGRAAHNSYIESVYYLGLIGLLLYIAAFAVILLNKHRPFKRKVVNYIGALVLMMAFAFLCSMNRTEIKYYLMICYIIYNSNFGKHKQMNRQQTEV